jgi:NitT/TauT family transport system ATP-binding protein
MEWMLCIPSEHMTDITIQQLSVTYPIKHRTPLPALEHISFAIPSGAFVALVGPSGCGKTTLLRVVGGLLSPTSGTVTIGTDTPDQARQQRRISLMFQQAVLLPWRTALHNIELPLQVAGMPPQQRRTIAHEFLALVGLGDFAQAYPHQLSGGMKQRVALARALAFQPSVLLMDEPFAALDEMTRERLNSELLRIWTNTRATVLFITHALAEAVFLADRVMVLSQQPGCIIADMPIPLPRPRTPALLEQAHFWQYVTKLRRMLHPDSLSASCDSNYQQQQQVAIPTSPSRLGQTIE